MDHSLYPPSAPQIARRCRELATSQLDGIHAHAETVR
jgi:hypothetical protein